VCVYVKHMQTFTKTQVDSFFNIFFIEVTQTIHINHV